MSLFREESDFIGKLKVPLQALYGIHSLRAKKNFPDTTPFFIEWYKAIGLVKLACYETYKKFLRNAKKYYSDEIHNFHFNKIEDLKIEALIQSATEVSEGKFFEHFIVPAVQGGAGTSINMNINEIIANRALEIIGLQPGNYKEIDPIEHANIFQSTNDVIPTSLKLAVIKLLTELETAINNTRSEIERLETQYRNIIRLGYTQMQEAVPTTYGRLFSTYNEALSRDWWRVSKAFERIKVVNLGGSAIGTGLTVPRFFIIEVVQTLCNLTGLPISRSENLSDATSNHDSLVEVHAILKAHAVNLEKMASDLRLLSSDLFAHRNVKLSAQQAGSSIMPGKVNPVISEFLISVAHKVYANDVLISNLSAQGCLELNPYLPVIGHSIIDSLKLLIAANISFKENLLLSLTIDVENYEYIYKSPTIATVLIPYIGYKKATEIALKMKNENKNIFAVNDELNFLDKNTLLEIMKPDSIMKLGYTLKEIKEKNERKNK